MAVAQHHRTSIGGGTDPAGPRRSRSRSATARDRRRRARRALRPVPSVGCSTECEPPVRPAATPLRRYDRRRRRRGRLRWSPRGRRGTKRGRLAAERRGGSATPSWPRSRHRRAARRPVTTPRAWPSRPRRASPPEGSRSAGAATLDHPRRDPADPTGHRWRRHRTGWAGAGRSCACRHRIGSRRVADRGRTCLGCRNRRRSWAVRGSSGRSR